MSQQLQYFQAYCKLNDLPYDESRWELAQLIIDQNYTLVSHSRRSYFLDAFDAYCQGNTGLEELMTLGDGVNIARIQQQSLASQSIAQIQIQDSLGTLEKNLLIVVDQIAVEGYDIKQLSDQLAQQGSVIHVVYIGLGNGVLEKK